MSEIRQTHVVPATSTVVFFGIICLYVMFSVELKVEYSLNIQ